MVLPPISDDEAALLRGVCLDPWDDLPRLVMADWLEDHGQADRAGYIRAWCAFARDPSDAARGRAWAAQIRLLKAGRNASARRTLGDLAKLLSSDGRGGHGGAVFGTWPQYDAAAAAGLWGRAPVVQVEVGRAVPLTDRRLLLGWKRSTAGRGSHLAPGLYDRLAGLPSPVPAFVGDGQTSYATSAAAREALSRVMVDEGRAAVGLPPLAWPAFADPPA